MISARKKPPRRQGAILIVALVAMALASVLLTSLMTNASAQRRQLRKQKQAYQATWLVEAGLQRAVAQLAESADYRGETWRVSAEQLGGARAAVVEIQVERPRQAPNLRRVIIQADLPEETPARVRRRAQFTVQIPPVQGDAL